MSAAAPIPFWLVWSPDGARPPSYRHETPESARAEADRLADMNPGKKFYVLAPIASTVVERHTRQDFYSTDDMVPF